MSTGMSKVRLLGVALGSALIILVIAPTAALAGEGNGNYLGILSSTAPSGYKPSPVWYSLDQGQNLLTFQFNVTNLTAVQQSMSLQLSVNHVITYLVNGQWVNVSDGQPGVVNGAVVDGQFGPSTQVQDPNSTFTAFSIGPNATQTMHMSRTLPAGGCGYFQVDVAKAGLASQTGLIGFVIRVLGCGTPPITPSPTEISTTPNPSTATVGATLMDSAMVSGGQSPTGTITFTLYDPNGAVAYTEAVNVTHGNGAYSTATGHVAGAAGTWHWKAEYSGDANNKPSSDSAANEAVVISADHVLAQPSIITTPNPTSTTVAATLKDSATLTGGQSPTGTITFTLYDSSGAVAATETVNVTGGNGIYSTPTGHVAGVAGTWHWKAQYSGDANNNPAADSAAAESVTVAPAAVVPTGGVLADTGSTPMAQVLALVLIGFGALALISAFGWRRREL